MRPRSVAVIGATEKAGAAGRTVLWNLISSPFGGVVYPVNPKRQNILGIKAYPSLEHIPDQVDLAVIVTPAATVPGVIRECAEHGVKGAIVISAGFKEAGPSGVALEQEVLAEARKGKHPRDRAELPRRDVPDQRLQRDICARYSASGQRRPD